MEDYRWRKDKRMRYFVGAWICLGGWMMMVSLLPYSNAIWLSLPASGPKCVSEEIHNNVVVIVDYVVVPDPSTNSSPPITSKVASPYGNVLHSLENVTRGDFAFTTQEAGSYMACFWGDAQRNKGMDVKVNLEWRTGVAAKDWNSVAKKEKLEGVELELRKLEGTVDSIHENLLYLKAREAEMRIMSEDTNTRVAWLSTVSLAICIAASAAQILSLKHFFLKKKLI